jgi:hypothetical protein
MNRWTRLAALGLFAACAGGLAAAPAPTESDNVVKDRTSFLPVRKYQPLPGKVVGVLVSDVAKVMSLDGRGGPPDAMGFSRDSQSYRWIYVPVADKPLITGLTVPIGEKGEKNVTYAKLSMANAQTVKQWDVNVPYALVEVEVNDNQGSPAIEGFVATKMKVLDGSDDYPIKVAEVIDTLKKKYKTWQDEQQKTLDAAMNDAATKALKDEKATGPRVTDEVMHVTWLPKEQRLRVAFRTTITDGAYKFSEGGVGPVPPKGGAFPPPPPPRMKVRYGTEFGVEYGRAYEVSKKGDVVKTQTLTPESFQKDLPPPPAGGRFPIDRLPPGKD